MMQENICVHKTGRGERKKERVSETQRVRGERVRERRRRRREWRKTETLKKKRCGS